MESIGSVLLYVFVFGVIIFSLIGSNKMHEKNRKKQAGGSNSRQKTAGRTNKTSAATKKTSAATKKMSTAGKGTGAKRPDHYPDFFHHEKNTTRTSSTTSKNEILERAKRNTRSVHRSHMETDHAEDPNGQSAMESRFGTGMIGTAPSGVRSSRDQAIYEDRLRQKMRQEQNDSNSRSGQNRILESAKEDAIQTEIDNAEDGRSDLMEQVYRNIITGPEDSLNFDRDFLSEGIDMMNSFGL